MLSWTFNYYCEYSLWKMEISDGTHYWGETKAECFGQFTKKPKISLT